VANSSKGSISKHQLAEHALRSAQIGDLQAVAAAFKEEIARDSRNLDLPYNLAIVEEKLGHIHRAAALLTEVLQRKPSYPDATARLSRLLARYQIDDVGVLAPAGLRAALVGSSVALQPIVDAGLSWIATQDTAWVNGIRNIATDISERDLGRSLIGQRTTSALGHELLHLCLRRGIVKDIGIERLLTGVRAAILLDCRSSLFGYRDLTNLALALIVQGWNNDHAWAEAPEVGGSPRRITNRSRGLAGRRPRFHARVSLRCPLSAVGRDRFAAVRRR
jgi:hypothetical protein